MEKHLGYEIWVGKDTYRFDTAKEAFEYEAEHVNESLVKDPNCDNIINGGQSGTTNMVVVKDSNGNRFTVCKDDPRYISGELVQYSKGINRPQLKSKVLVRDKNNRCLFVDKNDDLFDLLFYKNSDIFYSYQFIVHIFLFI